MSRHVGSAAGSVAFLALSGFMPAWAQSSSDETLSTPSQVQTAGRGESGFAVMPHIRVSGIAGDVDGDFGLGYEDLFGEGVGLDLEMECLFPVGANFLGPYVTLSWETFEGKNSIDLAGDTLEPDRLEVLSIMAGVKWRTSLKKWGDDEEIFAFFHAGFGAAAYGAVKGTLTASGVPTSVDVFEATTVFTYVLGSGFKHDFGRFSIDFNFGFRFLQPPQKGDLDFESSTALVLYVGIGFGVEL